jgi:hypothetical protein
MQWLGETSSYFIYNIYIVDSPSGCEYWNCLNWRVESQQQRSIVVSEVVLLSMRRSRVHYLLKTNDAFVRAVTLIISLNVMVLFLRTYLSCI